MQKEWIKYFANSFMRQAQYFILLSIKACKRNKTTEAAPVKEQPLLNLGISKG